jgi:spermidine synthase
LNNSIPKITSKLKFIIYPKAILMKKLLSYLFPITVSEIETEKNGKVTVTYDFGKKLLNSQNANYSYGSLQKILEFGLRQVPVSTFNSVLILGFGGGSVVSSLREGFGYKNSIDAVDFDAMILTLALEEFGLGKDDQLIPIHQEAFAYLQSCAKIYDLIVVDLFVDQWVPPTFYTNEFWNTLQSRLTQNGYFIFNASIFGQNEKELTVLQSDLNTNFEIKRFDLVEGSNTLLVGEICEKKF